MKKRTAVFLTALLTAAALSGCGSKETKESSAQETTQAAVQEESVSSSASGGQEPVTIRFSWWGGEPRHKATMAAVDAFMEEYPWITVKCEYGAWDGWQDKVATQLAGGTAPDLMQINWNWLYHYSADGSKFVDLNTLSDIISLGNFPEANLEAMNAVSYTHLDVYKRQGHGLMGY